MFVPNTDPESNITKIGGLKQVTGKKLNNEIISEETSDVYLNGIGESHLPLSYLSHQRELHQMQLTIEQLKRDLKASEARFHNIISKNADSIIIVNKKGFVCFVNPSAEYLFGYKDEELLGKEFFGTLVVEDSACDLEINTDMIHPVGKKEVPGMRVVQTEVEAICKDREKARVEMRVVETEWEGEMAYLATLRDITDRKRTEEILWLYSRAMAAANTGIVIADATKPKFPNIYCNPAFTKVTGYSQSEVIGNNCQLLQGKDTDPAAIEQIRQALKNERECQVVLKNYRKDGKAFWNQLAISPVRDRNGKLTHFIGVQMDITERKEAEEALQISEAKSIEQSAKLELALHQLQHTHAQLVQSEKMSSLGLLVAGVAHEINNPISFIYGNITHLDNYTRQLLHLLKLYQQHYPEPVAEIQEEVETIELDFLVEDLTKMLSSMNIGVDRICQIVNSLRNFSRHDESEIKSVNIHEGIDSTLLILNHRLKAKGNTQAILIVKEYGNLPDVECYPGPLNQVFMNILSNAIDALEDKNKQQTLQEIRSNPSLIKISTSLVNNDYVAIKIADNGCGIPANIKQRIFDTFFTTKPVGKGTGMGLSISYQIIVERHKGELNCISEVGQGTEFIIKLPLRH
ncbi:PAS domain-containing sensor histidine kinase [Oscillatoriales cyanobacterium USR001]|nr:PAS domain-containing sensor histidine kinase [Oscillatoriales cyanobacterium USR001]